MGDDVKYEGVPDRAVWARINTMGRAVDEMREALLGKLSAPGTGAVHLVHAHGVALADHESRLTEAEAALTRCAQSLELIGAELLHLSKPVTPEALVRLEAKSEAQERALTDLKAELTAQTGKAIDRAAAVRLVFISAAVSLVASIVAGIFVRAIDRPQPPATRPAIFAGVLGGTP